MTIKRLTSIDPSTTLARYFWFFVMIVLHGAQKAGAAAACAPARTETAGRSL
jgi:hypothetical protein